MKFLAAEHVCQRLWQEMNDCWKRNLPSDDFRFVALLEPRESELLVPPEGQGTSAPVLALAPAPPSPTVEAQLAWEARSAGRASLTVSDRVGIAEVEVGEIGLSWFPRSSAIMEFNYGITSRYYEGEDTQKWSTKITNAERIRHFKSESAEGIITVARGGSPASPFFITISLESSTTKFYFPKFYQEVCIWLDERNFNRVVQVRSRFCFLKIVRSWIGLFHGTV